MFSKVSLISSFLKPLWKPSVLTVRHYAYPLNFLHFLQNQNELQVNQLENGLTVSTYEKKHICHACIALFIPAGARYERSKESGVTHFFQRIAFNATENRNSNQMIEDMNAIGARFKSFTTRDMTVFYTECLCEDVPLAMNILSSVVFFNALAGIEDNKRVVYQEMLDHEKNSNALVHDLLHEAAFQNTPLAQTVLGKTSDLNGFDPVVITEYLRRRFSPIHTHLVTVGNVAHQKIVCLAEKLIGHIDPCVCPERRGYRYSSSDIRFRDDSLPLANVAVAVEAPSFGHPDTVTLQILSSILGSWDRSMPGGSENANGIALSGLEGTQVAYKPLHIMYHDCALWGVQFLSARLGADDAMLAVLDEFMRLCVNLTDAEAARGRHARKTTLLTRTQNVTGLCMNIGHWMLCTGCWPAIHEQIRTIDSKTLEEVKRVADHYLYDREPVLAAVGPTEELTDIVRVRSGLYWLRY